MMSRVVVTEGQLHFHTKILVNWVPENVPSMPISFIFHKYCLNRVLIQCLSNRREWIKLSWCDFNQRESSRNLFLFQFRIESLWFKFTEFSRPTFSTSKLFLRSAFLKILLPLRFSTRFSLSILIVPYHRDILLARSDVLLTESKMSQLFALLESGIVVTVGPCGFIPVRL